MTVVVAYADGERVWMAADSQATDAYDRIWSRAPSDSKIVRLRVGDSAGLFASEGAGEMGAIARYRMRLDAAPDPGSDEDCNAWANAVAESFAELAVDRVPKVTTEEGQIDGRALIGHAGRLWLLAGSAALRISRYTSIGGGGDLALGAMCMADAVDDLNGATVMDHLVRAVEVACTYDAGCGGPTVTAVA